MYKDLFEIHVTTNPNERTMKGDTMKCVDYGNDMDMLPLSRSPSSTPIPKSGNTRLEYIRWPPR